MLPGHLRGGAVAIGNFDGMHRGHQAVIARLMASAAELGVPALALTFEPHPRDYFSHGRALFRLTPPHVKAILGEALGLDGMVALHFDAVLAGLSAGDFVREILVKGLGVRQVTVGFDFCFGARRAGTANFLIEDGERHGFAVDVVEACSDEGDGVLSSSRVRACLGIGDIAGAAGLLGWHWFFEGEVIHGAQRGRTIGYPTANLRLPPECGLAEGIYAVIIAIDGVRHHGVASFGRRPTFDNGAPLFETHVFDYSGDLYGKTVTVWPISRLRGEMKFDGVAALLAQMDCDSAEARAVLAAVSPNSRLDRAVIAIERSEFDI